MSPSAASACAAFVDAVSPIDPADAGLPPCLGERGDGPRLPRARRPDQDVDGPARGEHPVRRLHLVVGQARAAERRLRAARRIGRAATRISRAGRAE